MNELLIDLEEYDTSVFDSREELNLVAGGDYWQKIINDYKCKEIDCYSSEKRLSAEYKNNLKKA